MKQSWVAWWCRRKSEVQLLLESIYTAHSSTVTIVWFLDTLYEVQQWERKRSSLMGWTRRIEFSGRCSKIKWQSEYWGSLRNDLEVSEGGKSIEVETRMRELKKKCMTILILSQWINSGWFTFHVGPYVLIQIIRNCSGYVKCKLHTQHHWQGTSWIMPGWGEISCPFSARQRNAGDWGGVAEGLRARDAPRLLAHQINYKL